MDSDISVSSATKAASCKPLLKAVSCKVTNQHIIQETSVGYKQRRKKLKVSRLVHKINIYSESARACTDPIE